MSVIGSGVNFINDYLAMSPRTGISISYQYYHLSDSMVLVMFGFPGDRLNKNPKARLIGSPAQCSQRAGHLSESRD